MLRYSFHFSHTLFAAKEVALSRLLHSASLFTAVAESSSETFHRELALRSTTEGNLTANGRGSEMHEKQGWSVCVCVVVGVSTWNRPPESGKYASSV
jgi:hypothetical protein